jgi:hypothetical protein
MAAVECLGSMKSSGRGCVARGGEAVGSRSGSDDRGTLSREQRQSGVKAAGGGGVT